MAVPIGPKYVRPTAPVPAAYKESKDWKKAQPQDAIIRRAWWKIFNDRRLDALEDQVNISNQNIAQAQAQYAQAYALVQASKSAFFRRWVWVLPIPGPMVHLAVAGLLPIHRMPSLIIW